MVTSIQISEELKEALKKRKMSSSETYEDIIWDLLEDAMELSDETKLAIAQAEEEYQEGDTLSLDELKKELDL